jgi:hypothetical protein
MAIAIEGKTMAFQRPDGWPVQLTRSAKKSGPTLSLLSYDPPGSWAA